MEELNQKLLEMGQRIGYRYLELSVFRDKNSLRQIRCRDMLNYVSSTIWKGLFGKTAYNVSSDAAVENRYMIYEKDPLENRYVSLPKNYTGLYCTYFSAGIISGVLNAAEFPATVRVVLTAGGDFTAFIIDFAKSVMEREANLK